MHHYPGGDDDDFGDYRGRGGGDGGGGGSAAATVGRDNPENDGYRVHQRGGDRSAPRDLEQEALERGRRPAPAALEGRREQGRLRSGRSASGVRIGIGSLRRRDTERIIWDDDRRRRGNRWP